MMNLSKYLLVVFGSLLFSHYGYSSPVQEEDNNNQALKVNVENSTSSHQRHNSQEYIEEMQEEEKTFHEKIKNSILLLRRELYVEDKRISELSPKSRAQVLISPQFSQMKMEFQALEEEWAELLKGYSTFTIKL